jgi:glycosyltransferase involved in cell wall biosynthesis
VSKKAALISNKPIGFSGGVERFSFYLHNLLTHKGYEVDIYHTENVPLPTTYSALFGINQLTYAVSSFVRRRKQSYTLIISNGGFGWGLGRPHAEQRFFNVYHGTAAGLKNATRHLLNFKTYFLTKYLQDGLVERLSGVWKTRIAVSESVKQEVQKEYWLDAAVVNNGIDTSHFKKSADPALLKERYAIPLDRPVGLFAGRADFFIKGLDKLNEIISKMPEVFWLLVVGGDTARLPQPGNNVRIIKDVPYEQMPALYSMADFALYLSRYEGNAYYLLEALACEVPVIATPAGAARELYTDDLLQKLFLPEGIDCAGAVDAIVEKCRLCRSREMAARIGKRGRELVEEKYSLLRWEEAMTAVLEI